MKPLIDWISLNNNSVLAVSLAFFLFWPALFPSRNKLPYYLKNWFPNFTLALINNRLYFLILGGALRGPESFFYSNPHGLFHSLGLNQLQNAIIGFLVIDLIIYFWHRLNHEVTFLWLFHATHHSDQKMDASSAFRFHFIEVGLSLILRGGFYFVLGINFDTILIYELIYNFFNFFAHSDINLNPRFEKILGLLFITPRLHQTHHSVEISLHNSNYGTVFSFWDRLFNSFSPTTKDHIIHLGVNDIPYTTNPVDLLLLPYTYHKKLKDRVNKA